jgi:hypothetical protein
MTPTSQHNNNNNNEHHNNNSNKNNHTTSTTSSLVFHTLAPGSTGALNGLGPNRWDIPPYGPPVIHMMIHTSSKISSSAALGTPNKRTLFIDVPILMSKTTLESTKYYGSDYRGPAWVATKPSSHRRRRRRSRITNHESYQITRWEPQPEKNQIRMEMDVFIPHPHESNDVRTTIIGPSRKQILCPSSYWYGFPTSFFVEPIAVCAPSLLDFFPL